MVQRRKRPTTASLYCVRGTNSLLYQLEQSATCWDGAVALGAMYLGLWWSRVPPRGVLRPVTCTGTHVKRSLHSRRRSYHVTCVALASGVSMTSVQSPGSATHPHQQRSKSLRSQHASRGGTRRPRDARSLRSSLLLWMQPAAQARRTTCPAASSNRPAMRLVDVGSCGTGLARIKSDVTECMPCHGTGDERGWQPHDSGCEGWREEWCKRCA